MIIIRNICHDIKEKIHDSDKDIRKAIELKYEYPILANDYYEFSVERMQEALDLHSKVVKIIEEYRKQEGEPNETMRNLWEFEHKIIIEQSEDVKILQKNITINCSVNKGGSLGYLLFTYIWGWILLYLSPF